MHTPGGGEKRETLPFGFCVRKKKESLECFSLEDWRIARYTEREREKGLPFEPFDQSGRTEEGRRGISRYIDYRNFERASYVALRAIAPARHDSPRLRSLAISPR